MFQAIIPATLRAFVARLWAFVSRGWKLAQLGDKIQSYELAAGHLADLRRKDAGRYESILEKLEDYKRLRDRCRGVFVSNWLTKTNNWTEFDDSIVSLYANVATIGATLKRLRYRNRLVRTLKRLKQTAAARETVV